MDERDSGNSRSNILLDKQITQNEADLEAKRRSLYDSKLSIIKSQGKENWSGTNPAPKADIGSM